MKNVFGFGIMAVALSSLVTLSSCSVTAHSQRDKTVNFKQLHTFSWSTDHHNSGYYDNDLVSGNIKQEVNAELKEKGWLLDDSRPDVVLDYNIGVDKTVQRNYNPSYPYYGGGGSYIRVGRGLRWVPSFGYGYGGGNSYYNTTVNEGVLTLNMYRANDHRLIWQGVAEGSLNRRQFSDKDIHREVAAVMRKLNLPN